MREGRRLYLRLESSLEDPGSWQRLGWKGRMRTKQAKLRLVA